MRTRLRRFSPLLVLFLAIVLIAPAATAVGAGATPDSGSHAIRHIGANVFPAWIPSGVVVRLGGPTRYETSVAISQQFYGTPNAAAYLARGDDFPDGLAGVPPAGREVAGPILLTERDAIPAVVAEELIRLQPQQIFILGGPGAISDVVAAQATAYTSGTVTRLAGATRYETAAAISSRFYSSIYNGNLAVCIARGDAFPDALAGGPLCSTQRAPILLTPGDALPEVVTHEIDSLQVSGTFYILGGEAAVSPAIEQWLVSYVNPGAEHDPRVVRLAGADRFETAAAVYWEKSGCWSKVAFIATGRNFPDALAGGAPAAKYFAPILLVDTNWIPSSTAAALNDLKPAVIFILGGENAVSAQVEIQLQAFISP